MRAANSPQSVTRVIQIVEALCSSAEPLGLAQLSRTLDAPKSSIAALLRGLARTDFVVATEGRYRLGPAAFGLGSALVEARRHLSSSDLIRHGMRRLAEKTGETVLLAVANADRETTTYVDVVESRNAVRFTVSAGDQRPLYCTAGGRVLLASFPGKVLAQYLKRLKPRKLTSRTVTDKRKIAMMIEDARRTGVGRTLGEAAEGLTGTAAAIHGAGGEVIGALVVGAPSSRIPGDGAELARLVLAEARSISRHLGYRAP
jgi:DNA-binding IclR family transcriptional regulator